MKTLALDLATVSGWALLDGERLAHFGLLKTSVNQQVVYPVSYVSAAQKMAIQVADLVRQHGPGVVVIEETNQQKGAGQNRMSQKLIEFIHFAVIDELAKLDIIPVYMDTARWQSLMGIYLSATDKAQNKAAQAKRDLAKTKLKEEIALKVDAERVAKFHENPSMKPHELRRWAVKELKERLQVAMRSVRTSSTRRNKKHLAVERVNQMFGLGLKQVQNHVADAILLGLAHSKAGYSRANTPGGTP